jgi:hypothetical protein
MPVSTLVSKNRISLPNEIVEAARLRVNDEIHWTVDAAGEIRGRKLEKVQPPISRAELLAYYSLPDDLTPAQLRAALPRKEPR